MYPWHFNYLQGWNSSYRSFETLEERQKIKAVDESDIAQLCIYVRFFDSKCFREKLLHIKPPTLLIPTATFRHVGWASQSAFVQWLKVWAKAKHWIVSSTAASTQKRRNTPDSTAEWPLYGRSLLFEWHIPSHEFPKCGTTGQRQNCHWS